MVPTMLQRLAASLPTRARAAPPPARVFGGLAECRVVQMLVLRLINGIQPSLVDHALLPQNARLQADEFRR